MKILISLLFFLLVGCATNPPPESPPVPKQPIELMVPQQAIDTYGIRSETSAELVFIFYIAGADGIRLHADGEVELDEGLELSEASVRFWRAIAQAYRQEIVAICEEGRKE